MESCEGNDNGVVFQWNQTEWFYLVEDANRVVNDEWGHVVVRGPFVNSLQAGAHMQALHAHVHGYCLVYNDQLQKKFDDQLPFLKELVRDARTHPKQSCASSSPARRGMK